ncbi:pyridoxal phosphate-dependent aminotransferase [Ferrovibrio sp.]|uniref:pyridoxal phosphate-dependent aminotransferase n=1 Tax=Ferrovibrio sp. TaxID=1917215 RepID=UPI003D09AB08
MDSAMLDDFPLPQPSGRSEIEIYRMWRIYNALLERKRRGAAVVNLLVGEPYFPPPSRAIAAAEAALRAGPIPYTEALGMRRVRQAIAGYYRRRHDLEIPAERIAVTVGSSSGFMLSFLAAFDAGQRVAVVEPSYPAYRGALRAVNLEPYRLGTDAASGFRPTAAMIEALPADIAGVVLASPANPTGTMLRRDDLAALYAASRRRGLWLIVDELYHGVTYGEPAETMLSQGPEAIVVNGFSKYWGMTGWRIGWLVLPERLVPRVEALSGSLQISAPTLSQLAAEAVLESDDEMNERVAVYGRNRARLLQALPRLGLDRIAPADGAFYLFCDVSAFTDDAESFCRRMLDETGVVVAPGDDFDTANGSHFVRFSFCVEPEVVDEAINRLSEWLPRQNRR